MKSLDDDRCDECSRNKVSVEKCSATDAARLSRYPDSRFRERGKSAAPLGVVRILTALILGTTRAGVPAPHWMCEDARLSPSTYFFVH